MRAYKTLVAAITLAGLGLISMMLAPSWDYAAEFATVMLALSLLPLQSYIRDLRDRVKILESREGFLADKCSNSCPYFYDMEYKHQLKIGEFLDARQKATSEHLDASMDHLEYATEQWSKDKKQAQVILALLNKLPDDKNFWEDSSQARQIEDSVNRLAESIYAEKNEDGFYSIEQIAKEKV